MDFDLSERQTYWRDRVVGFMRDHVFPAVDTFEAQTAGFRLDTAARGNGKGGHAYGTDLDDAGRRALVEYLKTR